MINGFCVAQMLGAEHSSYLHYINEELALIACVKITVLRAGI